MMKKLGILVMALVLVFGMSFGVMAFDIGDYLHSPLADDYKNDLGDEQTIGTNVVVQKFASFVTESWRAKEATGYPNLTAKYLNPNFVDKNKLNAETYLADPVEKPDISNIIVFEQYKWTLRANTTTQTTVSTSTPNDLATNADVFYEFSSEHDELNNAQWVRYIGPNTTEAFGNQNSGEEIGFVMVGMDANKYLNNWENIEADDYNMSVTFTISAASTN